MELGLERSYLDKDNGMTKLDMQACVKAAETLGEVIMFRSTGKWSLRWLERNHPSKNFHLKGKSADWGPQAGFVPLEGRFSKKVGNLSAENKSTKANLNGIEHHHQHAAILSLDANELVLQKSVPVGGRTAIQHYSDLLESQDKLIVCQDSTGATRHFVGIKNNHKYDIYFLPSKYVIKVKKPTKRETAYAHLEPVRVMVTHGKPITGDYDLLTICPKWADYGNKSKMAHSDYDGEEVFQAGVNLDKVMDMSLHTGRLNQKPGKHEHEHAHMGNLTPRVLRCVNLMNKLMGAANGTDGAYLRRVHHNMESLRPTIFGAITGDEMTDEGEGFPFTAFVPKNSITGYGNNTIITLHNMNEFKNFIQALQNAGFQVQKNRAWGLNFHGMI
ncbi:hypothetical protein HR060_02095 [Catenovulum sp. SM1970]|uniref:anthrax toxin-like adenylyl cyclase domain-containing protein n=1 Tax=Marinifaba aquimaris TaxID=2741323 RepID=UPI001571C2B7|nr:anthrax toxin-like adenylyl cyclase domain-containing protein [Marinifaba aquimaris]NTS75646.1 hypothetical protein [Marinifaba aquimaris]